MIDQELGKVPTDCRRPIFGVGQFLAQPGKDGAGLAAIDVALLKELELVRHLWIKLADKGEDLSVCAGLLTSELVAGKG